MSQAWALYDDLLLDRRVAFLGEPAGLETPWRQWSQLRTFSPNVWGDAYLGAVAQAAGFELITFDSAFRQYTGLQQTILS